MSLYFQQTIDLYQNVLIVICTLYFFGGQSTFINTSMEIKEYIPGKILFESKHVYLIEFVYIIIII